MAHSMVPLVSWEKAGETEQKSCPTHNAKSPASWERSPFYFWVIPFWVLLGPWDHLYMSWVTAPPPCSFPTTVNWLPEAVGHHQKARLLGSGVIHLYFHEETKVQEPKWWAWNIDQVFLIQSSIAWQWRSREITRDVEESLRNQMETIG